ncbi:MAG: cofactor-independent phosphoglycerate mutase [Chitinispirillaceae bacterium]|nr:cofactor-independent phosphoglycerate mutase [Chitinispirillaceae bacterium]
MKPAYAILVGDGMADLPIAKLGNMTPLAYAKTPNMDRVAQTGIIGMVSTVPEGLLPGSDVANLSLLGYDPAKYYSGRAPIAFRCNLVTMENGRMTDYSGGHIETAHAHDIIALLKKNLDGETICFHPGVSYRHLLVIPGFPQGCVCTPPHDITGKAVNEYLPSGPGCEELLSLMSRARSEIADAPAEIRRGVTDIWLWGQGKSITLPTMQERFGLSGSVISAVDLVRGLGILAGLTVRIVKGATGYLGTNYAGKVAAAQAALVDEDFVFLHVEAPDETSHQGSLEKKIQAIEEFDRNVVGEMLRFQEERPNLQILVAPDHATPVSLKTHTAQPVPFTACGTGIHAENSSGYCEAVAQSRQPISGPELFERFIKNTLQK